MPEANPNPNPTINPMAEVLLRHITTSILQSIQEMGDGDIKAGAQRVQVSMEDADRINAKMMQLLKTTNENMEALAEDITLIADFIEDLNEASNDLREAIRLGNAKGTINDLILLYGEAHARNEAERMEEPEFGEDEEESEG